MLYIVTGATYIPHEILLLPLVHLFFFLPVHACINVHSLMGNDRRHPIKLNEETAVEIIYFSFSKTFDMVSLYSLIRKLTQCSLNETIVR